MHELDRSASAIDKVLRRHYGTTVAKEVRSVVGDANNDLLSRTHELIREYWSRASRLGNKHGDLPEIGMTSGDECASCVWHDNGLSSGDSVGLSALCLRECSVATGRGEFTAMLPDNRMSS